MKTCITQGQQITRGVLRIACITALGMAFTFAAPPPPYPADAKLAEEL